MAYNDEELMCIGEQFRTKSLLDWTGQILQAAQKDLEKLQNRGVTDALLREIEEAREEIRRLGESAGKDSPNPLTRGRRETIAQAIAWRKELLGLALAVYDSDPETLAAFRGGIRLSRSIPKLRWELSLLLNLLRERRNDLRGVGVTDEFLRQGEEIAERLHEAGRRLDEERGLLPADLVELWRKQGVLYTRARFVARVARTVLPDRYTYDALRRGETATARRSRGALTGSK